MELQRLKELSETNIATISGDLLVELENVRLDMEKAPKERIMDFAEQIHNPYCFKCKGMIVKLTFGDGEASLEDFSRIR